jgi:GNAT superfamily N-acetyltransferase
MTALHRLLPSDLPRLRQWMQAHWGGEALVLRGQVYPVDALDGFAAVEQGSWTGLVTFRLEAGECEVMSLDSLVRHQGTGTALLQAVIDHARRQGARRVHLTTTNDNLDALRFYQRRGFRLSALRPGAVDAARQLKPAIPLSGEYAIPLHDELELEHPISPP